MPDDHGPTTHGGGPDPADRDRLESLAWAHAAAEADADMDATLATLVDDPVYEFQPTGLVLSGMDRIRRYYEHFFGEFQTVADGAELRGRWASDDGLGLEYTVWTRDPATGQRERHDVLGILLYGPDRLTGERVYASDRLLGLMVGPVLEEARPL